MKYIILLFLFIAPLSLFSQTLPTPPWPLISDYGARNINNVYDWHWGLDYDGNTWDSINPVEGGSIVGIVRTGSGWYIRVNSVQRYWTYFHIFNDELPSISPDNRYELRQAILENPETHATTPAPVNIIIFWLDRANNIAEKILSSQNDLWVQTGNPDFPYIITGSTWTRTQSAVVQDEVIAPMGTSGGVGSHLHLACSSLLPQSPLWYDVNPLYHVKHSAPAYTLSINQPIIFDVWYTFKIII